MIWQTISTSSAETERLGGLLGKQLKGGEIIELRSDLGGGKTTFVRGVARGAGYKGSVASPTFTLNRLYQTKDFYIYHFDFYRLDDAGILAGQLAESVNEQGAVVIVEWADIVKDVLPKDRISIEFIPVSTSANERRITVNYTQSFSPAITELENDWQETKP